MALKPYSGPIASTPSAAPKLKPYTGEIVPASPRPAMTRPVMALNSEGTRAKLGSAIANKIASDPKEMARLQEAAQRQGVRPAELLRQIGAKRAAELPDADYGQLDPLNILDESRMLNRYQAAKSGKPFSGARYGQEDTFYAGSQNVEDMDRVAASLVERFGPEVQGQRASQTIKNVREKYYSDLKPDEFARSLGLRGHENSKDADTKPMGLGSATVEAFKAGAAAPVAGTVRAYGDIAGDREAQQNADYANAAIGEASQDVRQGRNSAGGVLVDVAQSAPLMLATGATGTVAGTPAALGAMGLGSGLQKYGQNRSEGYGVGESAVSAGLTGLTEAGSELLPASVALKRAKGLVGQAARMGEASLAESATEPYSGIGEAVGDTILGKPLDLRQQVEEAKRSAIVGGVSGGTLAVPGAVADAARKVASLKQRRAIATTPEEVGSLDAKIEIAQAEADIAADVDTRNAIKPEPLAKSEDSALATLLEKVDNGQRETSVTPQAPPAIEPARTPDVLPASGPELRAVAGPAESNRDGARVPEAPQPVAPNPQPEAAVDAGIPQTNAPVQRGADSTQAVLPAILGPDSRVSGNAAPGQVNDQARQAGVPAAVASEGASQVGSASVGRYSGQPARDSGEGLEVRGAPAAVTAELTNAGKRVLYRGNASDIRARLKAAGLPEGMLRRDNGTDIGISISSSLKDRADAVLLGPNSGTSGPNSGVKFSRSPLIDLAQDRANMVSSRTDKGDMPGILSEMIPSRGLSASEVRGDAYENDGKTDFHKRIVVTRTIDDKTLGPEQREFYRIERADTNEPYVVILPGERDIGGAVAYQTAFAWAHNNGKVMHPDPKGGLTPINHLRRSESMLSSAAKFGTTKHLEPDRSQYIGFMSDKDMSDAESKPLEQLPALNQDLEGMKGELWAPEKGSEGERVAIRDRNIHNLQAASAALAIRRVPKILEFGVDDNGRFVDANGKVAPDDFGISAKDMAASGVGRSTVARTVMALSALDGYAPGKLVVDAAVGKLRESLEVHRPPGAQNDSARPAVSDSRRAAIVAAGKSRGPVLYSEVSKAPAQSGASVSEVRSAIEKAFGPRILRRLEANGVLKIVTREDAAKLAGLKSEDLDGVKGLYADGQAYLVADQVSAEEAPGVLLHEVGVHYGLSKMLGADEFAVLQQRVRKLRESDPAVRKAWESVPADTPKAHQAEEALAYLVEQSPKHTLTQRIIDGIRRFLNRLGIGMTALENVSANDIRAMARDALHFAASGEKTEVYRGAQKVARPRAEALKSVSADIDALGGAKPNNVGDVRLWRTNKAAFTEGSRVKGVVYHGTNADIEVFDTSRGDLGAHFGTIEQANKAVARGRGNGAGQNIVPAYISLRNPLRLKDTGSFHADAIADQLLSKGYISRKEAERIIGEGWRARAKNNELVRGVLKQRGHDGVIYKNTTEGVGDSYIVFDANQIKSAIGNSGDFNPSDPSILYSRRTPQVAQAEAAQNRTQAAQGTQAAGPLTWTYEDRYEGAKGKLHALREGIQDKMLSILDAQEQIEAVRGVLEDSSSLYRRENLMHGRIGDGILKIERNHAKPLFDAMKREKVSQEDFETYLMNRHAEERNKAIAAINDKMPDGGSGISTADARAYLAGLPTEQRTKLERLARRVDAITKETRTRLRDSGIISDAQLQAMEAQYQSYVPLRGKEGVEAGYRTGGGIDVRGQPIKRALGRGEGNLASNILAEVFKDAELSVIQSEKARVGQTALKLALENPNEDIWTVEPVETERKFSDATGQVYEAIKNLDNDPGMLMVPFRGKRYRLQFHDPRMAGAVKNLSAEQLHGVFRFLGALNRYFSAVLTRYNPSFVSVNMLRDAIQGFTGIAGEHGMKTAAKVASNYFPAMRGLWRDQRGKTQNAKWQALARDFSEQGGKTSFGKFENVQEINARIGMEFKRFSQLVAEGRPISAIRKALLDSAIIKGIEDANDVVENTIRLATYGTLVEQGMSKEKAAEYAKNLTVNFNRRGAWGSALNAMFLFFNAATQGTHRTFRLLKNKKVLAAMGAMAGLQALMAFLAMGMKDDDDEQSLWEKIPDYEKQRNLIFVIPHRREDGSLGGSVFKVPMPYGLSLFPYMGGRATQFASDLAQDKDPKASKFVTDATVGMTQAFAPLPFDDGWSAAKPQILKVFDAIAQNKDDLGMRIRNDNPYSKYEAPRAAMGKDSTPEVFRTAATALNRLGGGDDFTPPMAAFLLDWAPEDLQYLAETFTGGIGSTVTRASGGFERVLAGVPTTANDFPIIRSLVGEVDDKRATAGLYYDNREEIERDLARIRAAVKEGKPTPETKYVRAGTYAVKRDKDGDVTVKAMPGSTLQTYRDAEKALSALNDRIGETYRTEGALERRRQIEKLQREREQIQKRLNRAATR